MHAMTFKRPTAVRSVTAILRSLALAALPSYAVARVRPLVAAAAAALPAGRGGARQVPRPVLAAALGALLVLSAACGEPVVSVVSVVAPAPAAPTPAPAPAPVYPPAPPAPLFPPLSRPGDIYAGPVGLYDNPSYGLTSQLATRYVLYADNTFSLQFSSVRSGFFEYRGRYARADAQVTFEWEGWSTAGPWGATGALRGDSLDVTYNTVMSLSDFVDGTYVRAP